MTNTTYLCQHLLYFVYLLATYIQYHFWRRRHIYAYTGVYSVYFYHFVVYDGWRADINRIFCLFYILHIHSQRCNIYT